MYRFDRCEKLSVATMFGRRGRGFSYLLRYWKFIP